MANLGHITRDASAAHIGNHTTFSACTYNTSCDLEISPLVVLIPMIFSKHFLPTRNSSALKYFLKFCITGIVKTK